MEIKYCLIHHSGGIGDNNLATSSHLTVTDIDNAHKARWSDFKSSLGYFVGYTFVITKDGKVTQTRKIGEEGAHTIGYNSNSVGICLVGNFLVETPTEAQKTSLKTLLINLCEGNISSYSVVADTVVKCSLQGILNHNSVSNTQCPALPLSFSRDMVMNYYYGKIEMLKSIISLLIRLNDLFLKNKSLAGSGRECEGRIII